MSLALTDEHRELASTARRWIDLHSPIAVVRAALDAERDAIPPFWGGLAVLGWLGLAVSEHSGGQGYGLSELAVVAEETGRACLPGPFVPTAIVAAALDRWAPSSPALPRLFDGSVTAGLSLAWGLAGKPEGKGLRVGGRAHAIWSGAVAGVILAPVEVRGRRRWVVLDLGDVEVRELPSFDPTRRLAELHIDGLDIAADHVLDAEAEHEVDALAAIVAGAEAVGVAQWCVDTAAAYAAVREQFGRPIGQFQAVKHRCAEMLVTTEAARAAVWDAARCFDDHELDGRVISAGAAAALAPAAAFRCAKDAIQVLGGIGYTWEHDAHLYLRRATALRHLLPAASVAREQVAAAVSGGSRRAVALELPPEAQPIRERVQSFVAELSERPKGEWNDLLADSGYLVSHWPAPWGLGAPAIEQLVIDECLAAARVRRRHLQVAGWVLPTLIAHGTAEQQERFIRPSLRGEITWCQMFSEPGAGSDLASLTTRAVQVDGGWEITGQKVWTTMAHQAQWAICLARTDPAAPKHEGIGCFLISMDTPGLDIRPLRELTGMALFNEVFLTDVFVPDEMVVGGPTDGWSAARTTLANERVSMASGSSFGPGVSSLFDLAARQHVAEDPLIVDRLGELVIDAHAIAMLGVRATLRALGGGQPGPEASVRKLLGVTHEQQVQEVGLELLGPDAAVVEGDGAAWTAGFLGNRALSIAGGTSEIQKNVIAERLLGLPKDP